MTLYAIVGVQLFGRMNYHCVLPGTDPRNVTIADLAIPDTMCSLKGQGGYECPEHMTCMKLEMRSKSIGFYGMFNDFGLIYLNYLNSGFRIEFVYCLHGRLTRGLGVYPVRLPGQFPIVDRLRLFRHAHLLSRLARQGRSKREVCDFVC